MNTIVYLIRHSNKFNPKLIETYNTKDSDQTKTEKKMLSVEGEKRAKILSEEKEFKNITNVYSSNYVRAMQTAKYFLEINPNLKLNIDQRFNERTKGHYDEKEYPNFFVDQYHNPEFKSIDGENQNEVNKRMLEAFNEVIENNKGGKIIIVSHGTAITFLLMNWCKLLDVQNNLLRKLSFNDKVIIDRIYKAPEVFKITLDDDKIINIENLEFEDLP